MVMELLLWGMAISAFVISIIAYVKVEDTHESSTISRKQEKFATDSVTPINATYATTDIGTAQIYSLENLDNDTATVYIHFQNVKITITESPPALSDIGIIYSNVFPIESGAYLFGSGTVSVTNADGGVLYSGTATLDLVSGVGLKIYCLPAGSVPLTSLTPGTVLYLESDIDIAYSSKN